MKSDLLKKTIGGLTVHFGEEEGRSNEDRHSDGLVDGLLTHEAAKAFLTKVYAEINEITKVNQEGSCGISAAITPDGYLTVANLGDSQVTVFAIDVESGEVTHEVINNLHNLSNNAEFIRILELGIVPLQGRIGGLAVSRAFGDKAYKDNWGLSHDPEFYSVNLKDEKYNGKKIFIEVACDGVEENVDVESRKQIISMHNGANIAEFVIKEAMVQRPNKIRFLAFEQKEVTRVNDKLLTNRDDITAYYIEVGASGLSELKGAALFSVFDGHIGSVVSEEAKKLIDKHIANGVGRSEDIDIELQDADEGKVSTTGTLIMYQPDLWRQYLSFAHSSNIGVGR